MFWTALMVGSLALVFAQLGAMSAWIAMLKIALLVALVILMGLSGILIWRKAFPRRQEAKSNTSRSE